MLTIVGVACIATVLAISSIAIVVAILLPRHIDAVDDDVDLR